MPSTIPLSYLTSTQFSILMFSQISLMTSSSNVDTALPLRRKDMQIADILQSTFVNTTNTLFLLDDKGNRARNFVASSTLAVIELAIKLFSHQKTSQIFALDSILDFVYLDRKGLKRSKKITEIKETPSRKSFTSLEESQSRHNQEGMQSTFEERWKIEHEYLRKTRKKDKEREEEFIRYRWSRDNNIFSTGDNLAKSTARTSFQKQINLHLSARTSIVIMLKNSNVLSSIITFPINIPSLSKIVFLYDECMNEGENFTKKQLQDFSEKFWIRFRILFTYFILFCPTMDMNPSLNCSQQDCKRQPGVVPERNKATTHTSDTLWNQLKDNNSHVHLAGKNFTLIQSLYVHNPFRTSDILNKNPSKTKSGLPEFGELRKINLNEDVQTIQWNVRKTFRTIFNGNGQGLRVMAFTTPNTIKKSDFSFLSRHLKPELVKDPYRSLDAFVGVEILMIQELATKMNFIIKLVPVTDRNAYGWKLPNGSFVGGLGDLIYQKADICMNGFFVKDYETKQLYFTTSIQDDKICVAVQTPALIPQSLLLFKVFTASVWLLLFTTFVVTSILYTSLLHIVAENNHMKTTYTSTRCTTSVLQQLNHRNINHPTEQKGRVGLEGKQQLPFKSSNQSYNRVSVIVSQCFRIIAVLLNASVTHSFNSSSYERIFVVLCLLLGLNLTGSFQGSLMDVYTTPRQYPSIDTLEQLDKTGMLIILEHAGLQTDIFGTEPPGSILGNLRSKIRVTGVADDILLSQIGSGQRFSALLRLGDFDRIKFKIPYRTDGRTLIHVIPDCPKSYNIAFLVNKSSELYATINHYLSMIAAGGLVVKWTRDSVNMFRLQGNLKYRELLMDSQIILTLSHLQLAFFTLFIGLFISVVLFVMEIFWERIRLKRIRKKSLRIVRRKT